MLLTLQVLQLSDVADCISDIDVEVVTVSEVLQDVFGVEGRLTVERQLREAQGTDGTDLKSAALEEKNKRKHTDLSSI